MRSLLLIALVCLCAHVALAQPDPCVFSRDPEYEGVWVTDRANLLACFNNIPFDAANRTALVSILNSTWNAYSFHDYVSQPIEPYNVQANLGPQILAAGSKNYASDYEMHVDFMKMFQSLLDAHTTYYLPNGYGSVYFATPFTVKSSVVNGVQKFYTGTGAYPYDLWVKVCGSSCPYTQNMVGWEISTINGENVPSFIKSFSRGGGTYYDDGVRANAFISGSLWGQSSLALNNMPAETFTVELINPANGQTSSLELPYAYGSTYSSRWNTAYMRTQNAYTPPDDSRRSVQLTSETLLLDALREKAGELRKRSASSSDAVEHLERVNSALIELTANLERIHVDTLTAHAMLRRDGAKAIRDETLPYIPSVRERTEDVMRLQQALFPIDKAAIERENKAMEARLARQIETNSAEAVHRRSSSAATAATEIPVKAGSSSQWRLYLGSANFESLSAYYGSYRGTSVVRLRSFSTTDGYWVASVRSAVTNRNANGLNGNLIIDVTNNGGGSVCLNYHTMSYLVDAWSNLRDIAGNDIVYSLYDLRNSELMRLLYQGGDLNYQDAFNPSTGSPLGLSYYTNPTSRTIGNSTGSYSRSFNWNPCGFVNGYFPRPVSHFNKIIVITDGRCGSSCAYFVTQLRENNKVRVVSYGGLYNEPLATSSFAGGNVYTWDYIRSTAPSVTANPYSSYIAYNIRENFSPNSYPAKPRQFERLEADWYLPFWDAFWRFTTGPTYNTTARFTLYESVLPMFNDVPAGLPGASSALSFSAAFLFVAAAIIALIM